MIRMPGVHVQSHQSGVNRLYSTSNPSSSAGKSVCYVLRGISAEYLLDPGVLGGHWFADETTSSLRPPTSRFSLVILTSNCLSCLCISFSLATHFLGVPRLLRCAFIFWIATWSQIAIKTCTRYGCLDLLKLRATHADAQSRRGCGTENPANHHTLPPATSSLY